MLLHGGEMDGIARRKSFLPQDNLLGTLGSRPGDFQHLIDNSKKCIESWLDGVTAVDSNIPMQYLLEDLRVGDEALTVAEQPLKQSLCVSFVRVRRAHQIHGNV